MADQLEAGFINLLPAEMAERVDVLLRRRGAVVVRPAATAAGFLGATGADGDQLDAWYATSPVRRHHPVVLLSHEEGLARLLPGLDAEFVVVVKDPVDQAIYQRTDALVACVQADAEALVTLLADSYGLSPIEEPPRLHSAQSNGDLSAPEPPVLDPFELLAGAAPISPAAGDDAPIPIPGSNLSRRALFPPVAGPGFHMQRLFRKLMTPRRPPSPGLGHAVVALKPLVVSVVSRKGGVGKTATAAGLAAVLGEALDGLGHTAALVDANIGNPDAWGRLEVNGSAPTVREISNRLLRGEEPPTPAYADTPALAIYPESRTAGDAYSSAEIDRFSLYLRARHAAVVVDLPNRLPSFTSGEAAVAAAWLELSDVVLLPSTGDPAALVGVLEYMDTATMRGKPAIVPYIVPRLRQIRDATEVRDLLGKIGAKGAAVVPVPDDDRATLALVERVSITEASNSLHDAYRNVADALVRAAPAKEKQRC